MARFYVHDRAKNEASELARYNHLRPRFLIVDRTTGSTVDEATSRYEARQAAQFLNLYPEGPR
jgi:hypothetical protein